MTRGGRVSDGHGAAQSELPMPSSGRAVGHCPQAAQPISLRSSLRISPTCPHRAASSALSCPRARNQLLHHGFGPRIPFSSSDVSCRPGRGHDARFRTVAAGSDCARRCAITRRALPRAFTASALDALFGELHRNSSSSRSAPQLLGAVNITAELLVAGFGRRRQRQSVVTAWPDTH